MTLANPESMREVCASRQGYVHSVETAGTVDGPGIRFVLFLNGCPLRCKYCHNPDTWQMRRGKLRHAGEILEEIRTYRDFLKRARGGVTLSGGEPLMQPAFLETILKGCKEMGLHTALDTSGHLHHLAPDSLFDHVDLVLLDIKSGDEKTFHHTTGKALQPTLDFAARMSARKIPMWIRFVLVPGLTDDAENIRAVARIIAGLKHVTRVEILPFHQLAAYKYENLGLDYALKETPQAQPADVIRAWTLFSEEGVYSVR